MRAESNHRKRMERQLKARKIGAIKISINVLTPAAIFIKTWAKKLKKRRSERKQRAQVARGAWKIDERERQSGAGACRRRHRDRYSISRGLAFRKSSRARRGVFSAGGPMLFLRSPRNSTLADSCACFIEKRVEGGDKRLTCESRGKIEGRETLRWDGENMKKSRERNMRKTYVLLGFASGDIHILRVCRITWVNKFRNWY